MHGHINIKYTVVSNKALIPLGKKATNVTNVSSVSTMATYLITTFIWKNYLTTV
jgi:hypothetical protein